MDSRFYKSFNIIVKITGLVFIVSLLSCSSSNSGGGIALYSVGGTVTGLQGSVTLRNNITDVLTLSSSGSFSFNTKLNSGVSYNVDIQTQPAGQTCTVSNASGIIDNADVTNVMVACVDNITLSGSYQAAPLIQVDSDVNDPFDVPNVNNGSRAEAQLIPNFSVVHGFATKSGTGRILAGDRFATVEDEFDIYRVNLQAGQVITLHVADLNGQDVFIGDLDLFLLEIDGTPVTSSESVDKDIEALTVIDDGDYYISVNAISGSSKYTLNLNGVLPANVLHQGSADFIPGEAIIRFKKNSRVNEFKASNQKIKLSHSKTTRAARAKFDLDDASSVSVLSSPNKRSNFMAELKQDNFAGYQKVKTLQEIKRLKMRADVVYAEPNYIRKPYQVPNDTFYDLQWHYPAINLPQAWDITTGSKSGGGNVIVAVVDTGVFLAHPELFNQLVSGYDFISDIDNAADGDGIDNNPDDPGDSAQLSSSSWHGTHVAGTVAAETDNNTGVAGVAWQAKIMPVRVLGTFGGSGYDIIQAIRYAAGLSNDSGDLPPQKADIINLSLGGGGFSQASQNAYTAVRDEGVIVVAAAGNENTSQLSYPASYDGVVSVSATDFANNRAPYSNFGSAVDIAAPGGSTGVDLNNDGYGDGVLSTLVDDSSGTRAAAYSFYQGTSMATPHVAGVFALMRSIHPVTPDEIDGSLASGALTTDFGAGGRDDIYGFGLIDALKAVQEAQRIAGGGVLPPAVVATPNQLTFGQTSGPITLTLSNKGGPIPAPDSPIVVGVVNDADWLTVAKAVGNVDPDSLGEYDVTIVRGVLSDSSYLGTITFTLSTGSTLVVQVSMDVGVMDKAGNPGTIYMLLLDSDFNVIDQVSAVDSGGGIYDYSFADVAAGSYRIVGGSDIDNDLFICQLAEACGGYPIINALSTVEANGTDITGLDFVVDILANFGASSLSMDSTIGSSGFRRTPVQATDNKQITR